MGGVLAARALRENGVEVIFALPGGHNLPLFEGARVEGLPLIDTRHEENAVFMAEGWALATGRPAVASATAGPGLANALPGIAEANAAGVPVVVIAGRTALAQRDRGAVQDLDQLNVVAPVTKWRAECTDPARIPGYVAEGRVRPNGRAGGEAVARRARSHARPCATGGRRPRPGHRSLGERPPPRRPGRIGRVLLRSRRGAAGLRRANGHPGDHDQRSPRALGRRPSSLPGRPGARRDRPGVRGRVPCARLPLQREPGVRRAAIVLSRAAGRPGRRSTRASRRAA